MHLSSDEKSAILTVYQHDWFYLDPEQKASPPPLAELKELFQKGSLTENSLVWNEGETEWKKTGVISGLIDAIKI